jgi:hypothetical protein
MFQGRGQRVRTVSTSSARARRPRRRWRSPGHPPPPWCAGWTQDKKSTRVRSTSFRRISKLSCPEQPAFLLETKQYTPRHTHNPQSIGAKPDASAIPVSLTCMRARRWCAIQDRAPSCCTGRGRQADGDARPPTHTVGMPPRLPLDCFPIPHPDSSSTAEMKSRVCLKCGVQAARVTVSSAASPNHDQSLRATSTYLVRRKGGRDEHVQPLPP